MKYNIEISPSDNIDEGKLMYILILVNREWLANRLDSGGTTYNGMRTTEYNGIFMRYSDSYIL